MDIAGQGLKIVVRLLGAQVAGAEDVLDATRHQQLLKLGGQVAAPVRDVHVA